MDGKSVKSIRNNRKPSLRIEAEISAISKTKDMTKLLKDNLDKIQKIKSPVF